MNRTVYASFSLFSCLLYTCLRFAYDSLDLVFLLDYLASWGMHPQRDSSQDIREASLHRALRSFAKYSPTALNVRLAIKVVLEISA
jgi:hypothetical protein